MLEQAERGTVLDGLVELNASEFNLLDDIMAGVANVQKKYDGELEPPTYEEAIASRRADEWQEMMAREWHALVEMETFTLCDLPPSRKSINCKWIYKVKKLADGSVDRLKARLCAVGTSQREGVDYEATFAPVVRLENLRSVLAYGAVNDLEIHQMDVDSAFLNGILEEEIYMKQLKGFINPDRPNAVLRLNQSIYGLKQAPRVWNLVLSAYLLGKGFAQSAADPCIFFHHSNAGLVIVAVYVDDCCIVAGKE